MNSLFVSNYSFIVIFKVEMSLISSFNFIIRIIHKGSLIGSRKEIFSCFAKNDNRIK